MLIGKTALDQLANAWRESYQKEQAKNWKFVPTYAETAKRVMERRDCLVLICAELPGVTGGPC